MDFFFLTAVIIYFLTVCLATIDPINNQWELKFHLMFGIANIGGIMLFLKFGEPITSFPLIKSIFLLAVIFLIFFVWAEESEKREVIIFIPLTLLFFCWFYFARIIFFKSTADISHFLGIATFPIIPSFVAVLMRIKDYMNTFSQRFMALGLLLVVIFVGSIV